MLFDARQLQEKCREQRSVLCLAFIDPMNVFDTINRDLLEKSWKDLAVISIFFAIVRSFHTNMKASVVVGGGEPEIFGVEVGVKQGCVTAPVVFNMYLAAATHLFRTRVSPGILVDLNFRLDLSVFKASAAFSRICKTVLFSHNIRLLNKIAV